MPSILLCWFMPTKADANDMTVEQVNNNLFGFATDNYQEKCRLT